MWVLYCTLQHVCMWKILTGCGKFLVSHLVKWRTWPERAQQITVCCGGAASGRAVLLFSCLRWSTSLDADSSWGSERSTASLKCIDWNLCVTRWRMGWSAHVQSSHSLYNCPKMSLQFSVSLNSNMVCASCPDWIFHASEAPSKVYHFQGSSVLPDHPLSTQDQRGVPSALGFNQVDLLSKVSIVTTFWLSKALQYVASGVLILVMLLCLQSGWHTSNFSMWYNVPLHHAFPSLFLPLDL